MCNHSLPYSGAWSLEASLASILHDVPPKIINLDIPNYTSVFKISCATGQQLLTPHTTSCLLLFSPMDTRSPSHPDEKTHHTVPFPLPICCGTPTPWQACMFARASPLHQGQTQALIFRVHNLTTALTSVLGKAPL